MTGTQSPAKVLIVDDEPDIRELLEITLGRMGLETVSAADLAEAYALLNDAHPLQLCLTDMRLPDGNGIELVEHIQREHPGIPVAMITAHGNVDSAIRALKAGAFDFISKPVALDKLRNLVSSALELDPIDNLPAESKDELIGGIGFERNMGPRALEVGYWTRTDAAGRGVMTEALGLMVDAAWTLPDVERIVLTHDATNLASARVADKHGFAEFERRRIPILGFADSGTVVWRERLRPTDV